MNPTRGGLQQFFDDLFHKYLSEIKVSIVCKINSFDASALRADVVPQLSTDNDALLKPSPLPVISGIPCSLIYAGGFMIKPTYRQGDLVWVSFSAHDISGSLSGNVTPTGGRIHGLENACVMGGVTKNGFRMPLLAGYPGAQSGSLGDGLADLVIASPGGSAWIRVTDTDLTLTGQHIYFQKGTENKWYELLSGTYTDSTGGTTSPPNKSGDGLPP